MKKYLLAVFCILAMPTLIKAPNGGHGPNGNGNGGGGPPPPPIPPIGVKGVRPDIYQNKWPDGTEVEIAAGQFVVAKPPSQEFSDWIAIQKGQVIPLKTQVKIPSGTIVEVGRQPYTDWAAKDFDPNFTTGAPPAGTGTKGPAKKKAAAAEKTTIPEKEWKKFPPGTKITLTDRTVLDHPFTGVSGTITNVASVTTPGGGVFYFPITDQAISAQFGFWIMTKKEPEIKPGPPPGPGPGPAVPTPLRDLNALDVALTALAQAVTP